MKLKRGTILLITLLVTGAILGLLAIQMALLSQTAKLKSQAFDQNVYGFQKDIVFRLEELETLDTVLRTSVGLDDEGTFSQTTMHVEDPSKPGHKIKTILKDIRHFETTVQIDSNNVILHLRKTERVRLDEAKSKSGKPSGAYMDTTLGPGMHSIPIDQVGRGKNVSVLLTVGETPHYISLDKSSPGRLVIDQSMDKYRRRLIDRVLNQYMVFKPIPITERLDFALLDSIVEVSGKKYWMPERLIYGIHSVEKDSIIYSNIPGFNNRLLHSEYNTPLFPNDLSIKPNNLVVYFPDRGLVLMKQLGISTFVALLFLALLLISFIILIRTLISQKKFAQSMIDFINNMTHEFKTPISTITLASEAIRKAQILQDQRRLVKYGNMIHDESVRMRKQVENILNMADLEKGEVELSFEPTDVHELIEQATEHFRLSVEKRKGIIRLDLKANPHQIRADKIHLMNVLNNLLDNSVKYTESAPEIEIRSLNVDGMIKIEFQDNGIGMKPEDQKRIFDKYYRVSTGNVHDVKGFGLGLAYVKHIVEAHSGSIDVESEPANGSSFVIRLPMDS